MKIVIQRVKKASVTIDQDKIASISQGLLVFLGIADQDLEKHGDYLVDKLVHLRIFSDENNKMNLSCLDISGDILVVSQFTLYGELTAGRRPSFIKAARPDTAIPLYESFVRKLKRIFSEKNSQGKVETGVFGADMEISLVNDGPVTLLLEKSD